jgi:hypothetical protein
MRKVSAVAAVVALIFSTFPTQTRSQVLDVGANDAATAQTIEIGAASRLAFLPDVAAVGTFSCGECEEQRAHPNMTVYYHRFPEGGGGTEFAHFTSAFGEPIPESLEPGENVRSGDDDWISVGDHNCWGTPDDDTCHPEELLTRCEDSHSECGGGSLLLRAALLSAEPGRAVRNLIASRASFELQADAAGVIIEDCTGESRTVVLPVAVTSELLAGNSRP